LGKGGNFAPQKGAGTEDPLIEEPKVEKRKGGERRRKVLFLNWHEKRDIRHLSLKMPKKESTERTPQGEGGEGKIPYLDIPYRGGGKGGSPCYIGDVRRSVAILNK